MKSTIRECIEYEKKNYPAACPEGVVEGEIYVFLSYSCDPRRYEEPDVAEIERFGYIENHMPGCAECRGVYDEAERSSQSARKLVEKLWNKKNTKPN